MAFVYKKPGSKYWYAFFRDAAGRRRNASTKETERSRAQRIADTYETAGLRKHSAHHVKSVFGALLRELYNEQLPSSSVRVFGTTWLEQLKPELAGASFDAYRKTVEALCEFLGPEKAQGDIVDIARSDIVAFRNQLAKNGLAIATVNRYVKITRMIFKAAERDSVIVRNPAEHVDLLKDRQKEKSRRPFTIPEIQTVLRVADPEWASMIRFGLYTGQRLVDCALIRWSNIDLENDLLTIVTRKTNKRMRIPIAAPLKTYLLSLPSSDDPHAPLHPRASALVKKSGRASAISQGFVELLMQAGLREVRDHKSRGIGRGARRTTNELSFHSLRHTVVSWLKATGVAHSVVQEFVGHHSSAVSQQYTHTDESALKNAAGKLPKI